MHVASLHLYPLKSCTQLDVESLDITPRGPEGDRRWLIVDTDGRFVTARQRTGVVGIRAVPGHGGLRLDAPGMPTLHVATPGPAAGCMTVAIWKDTVPARRCGAAADEWLTRYLGDVSHLVYMAEDTRRPVDPTHASPGDIVSFADGYPLLVISQASLDALNARLERPVPMARFRPNIVVDGVPAHAEDGWRRLRVGAVEFEAVKACTRCVFTTVDPATLARDPDGEPLRTLARYRRTPAGVTFGMNLIPRGRGVVKRGDPVAVAG